MIKFKQSIGSMMPPVSDCCNGWGKTNYGTGQSPKRADGFFGAGQGTPFPAPVRFNLNISNAGKPQKKKG